MFKFIVMQHHSSVAEVEATDRDRALASALHYAVQCVKDAPVSIIELGSNFCLHMATGQQVRERKKLKGKDK
jgi:hypothetical protein